MTFRLTKKAVNRALTTYHVLDAKDAIVGSFSVQNA